MPGHVRTKRDLLLVLVGIILCLAVTVALIVLYFWSNRRHPAIFLFALLVPAIWTFPFYNRIRRMIAERHFSRAELLLETHRPGLGQSFHVQLTLAARRTVDLTDCILSLKATESVHTDRRSTRTHQAACLEVPLQTPPQLKKNETCVFEADVAVPAEGMESFQGRGLSLRWTLEAHARLGKLSLLLDSQELVVRPVRSGPPQASPPERSAGERLRLTLRPAALQVGSKGRISVIVPDDLAASAASLAVALSWRSTPTDATESDEHNVFAGTAIDFKPAQPVAFDFLVPPAGPLSYPGKLFSITWTARASLHAYDGETIETTQLPVTIQPQQASL